jgi:hypothetical protein
MLNVFYNPKYFINFQKKIFFTKQFKYSIFFDVLIKLLYLFNLPYSESIIYYGPQMRMNHLIKTFKKSDKVSFNKNKSSNNYIVQFDIFGKKILDKILHTRNPETKILVGPLYTYEMDIVLNEYIEKYPCVKKIVASEAALEAQRVLHQGINENNIIICPSGIGKETEISEKNYSKNETFDCLIYFKKRDLKELKLVENFMKERNLTFNILEYGKYKQKELLRLAKNSKFGLVLDKTESQGFAIQYLMSENLPLIVLDYPVNFYESFEISGTSVPYWSEKLCGIKVNSIEELENNFDKFFKNIEKYSPVEYVLKTLTYEVFEKNILSYFEDDKLWST